MPTTAKERFTALQSGEIDVLSATPPGPLRATARSASIFAGVNYYDGQGFMVKKTLGVKTRQGAERRHRLRADRHHHRAQPRRLLPRQQDDLQAGGVREARRDRAGLSAPAAATSTRPTSRASTRSACSSPSPTTTWCCPRSSPRSRWARRCARATTSGSTIVKWVHYALLNAEEAGITPGQRRRDAEDRPIPTIKRILGKDGELGKGIGLDNDWVVNIVKAGRQLRRDASSATSARARASRSPAA